MIESSLSVQEGNLAQTKMQEIEECRGLSHERVAKAKGDRPGTTTENIWQFAFSWEILSWWLTVKIMVGFPSFTCCLWVPIWLNSWKGRMRSLPLDGGHGEIVCVSKLKPLKGGKNGENTFIPGLSGEDGPLYSTGTIRERTLGNAS